MPAEPSPAAGGAARQFLLPGLCIFAVAFLVRGVYVASFDADPFAQDLTSNAGLYDEVGQEIADGGRLQVRHGAQPLYPYVVGAVYRIAGHSPAAVRLFQVFLGSLTALLLGWIAWGIGGRVAGWSAGLLWATHWPAVFYGGELLPDTVGCTLLIIAVVFLGQAVQRGGWAGWLFGSMALFGAMLVKSNALALAPWPTVAVAVLPGLTTRVRIQRVVASFSVFVAVLLSIFAARAIYGSGTDSGAAQFPAKTIWDGNHEHSDGINPFITEYHEVAEWEVWDHPDDMSSVSAAVTADLVRFVREEPFAFASLLARKGIAFGTTWEVGNNSSVPWRRDRVRWLSLPWWPGFGAIFALAAVGAMSCRSRWRDHLLPWAWAVTWSASIVAILVAGRYRLPTTALLCPYAGVGVALVLAEVRRRDGRRLAVVLWILAVAALLTSLDPLRLRHYRIASVLQMEAQVLERAGDLAGAEERYTAGLDLERAGALLRRNYGIFLIRTGRPDEGFEQLRTAVAQEPDRATLHKDLGAMLREAGAAAEALPHLTRASELDPGDGGIQYNLGLVHSDLGQPAEAEAAFTRAIDLGIDESIIWLLRGVARAQQADYEGAGTDLKEAARQDPGNCEVGANLGLVHEKMGEHDLALEAYLSCRDDPVNRRRACRLVEDGRIETAVPEWVATICDVHEETDG